MNIERMIEGHEKAIEDLLDKQAKLARFGDGEQYEEDDAILFKRRADSWSKERWNTFPANYEFTYVAVKVAQGWWYVTGRSSHRFSWDQLVNEHLVNAVEVWAVTEWTAV